MFHIIEHETPIQGVTNNVAAVALGVGEDDRARAQIRLGYKRGESIVWTFCAIDDADLAEHLAHALMTAADHLRNLDAEEPDDVVTEPATAEDEDLDEPIQDNL